jgi:hypothetical protein
MAAALLIRVESLQCNIYCREPGLINCKTNIDTQHNRHSSLDLTMSDHRLSTVYDYSSLRIHPDGSRVNQSSRNLRPRIAKVSVQDPRGNWIARDAGGSATVARYRTVRDEVSDGEHFDFGDVGFQNSGSRPQGQSKAKGKAKETTTVVERRKRNRRSMTKRQKLVHDFDFLAARPQVNGRPLPSSVSTF